MSEQTVDPIVAAQPVELLPGWSMLPWKVGVFIQISPILGRVIGQLHDAGVDLLNLIKGQRGENDVPAVIEALQIGLGSFPDIMRIVALSYGHKDEDTADLAIDEAALLISGVIAANRNQLGNCFALFTASKSAAGAERHRAKKAAA